MQTGLRNWKFISNFLFLEIVGASLSKPHTSMTALCMGVCMLVGLFVHLDRALTINFK